MQIEKIVAELKAERSRLDKAIAALEGLSSVNGRRSVAKKRKKMSAAARKRISRAMKARWAAAKRKPIKAT